RFVGVALSRFIRSQCEHGGSDKRGRQSKHAGHRDSLSQDSAPRRKHISEIFFFPSAAFVRYKTVPEELSIRLLVRFCSASQFSHSSFHRLRRISFQVPDRLLLEKWLVFDSVVQLLQKMRRSPRIELSGLPINFVPSLIGTGAVTNHLMIAV